MPIPSPRKNETQDNFISRCLSNNTMQDEYPEQDERLAICFSSWRKHTEKKLAKAKRIYLGWG